MNGRAERITDAAVRSAVRRRAHGILARALLVAALVTLVALLLPR